MTARSRPAWLQVLATLILTGCASGIGSGLGGAVMSHRPTVIWAGALAAPLTLVAVVGLWRSGRTSAWWFLGVSVLIYIGVGLVGGGFRHAFRPSTIPIMALGPLVFPVAGLVWGGLLYQAASQGYLPFLGRHAAAD